MTNRTPERAGALTDKTNNQVPISIITGTRHKGGKPMSNDKPLSQAQVARELDVPASTIKYYTQLALLPYTQNGSRGHKRYDAQAVQERIELIGKLKAKGLTMAGIIKHFSDKGLLEGNPDIYALSLITGATNG